MSPDPSRALADCLAIAAHESGIPMSASLAGDLARRQRQLLELAGWELTGPDMIPSQIPTCH